jgi:hypothetical protein
MNQQIGVAISLSHEQLPRLHNLTQEVSRACRARLRIYLDVLAPLFRPRWVLGDHVEGAGREAIIGAEQNLAELRESYFRACAKPFDLRRDLQAPIESVPTQIQFYEWEYSHEIKTGPERKLVTVTAPLTWVLAYRSTYSLSMLRQVLAGKQERDTESLRAFALRACMMQLLFNKKPDLKTLFEGLRYQVEVRTVPQFGELPLLTISTPFVTTRPADDLLLAATGLSGRAAFEEILDESQAMQIPDPLSSEIAQMIERSNRSAH